MSYHESAYPGQRVSRLPRRYDNILGMQLQVDYLLLDDVVESFHLVQAAASCGANVGIDEYPDEESFREHLEIAEAFTLKDESEGKVMALIVIHPFLMSRTIPIYLARIFIYYSVELGTRNAFPNLMELSQELTKELRLSYSAMVMLVFRKCETIVLELRRQKFLVVACLPLGGTLVGDGPCETFVLYKEISGVETVEWSLEDKKAMAAKIVDPCAVNASRFPNIPSLPVSIVLRDNTRVRLRVMRPNECEAVYDLFLQAARMGNGYSVDETLSIDTFTDWFLLDHYNIVWEEAETGQMMAFSSVGDESCKRSPKATVCDSTVVLRPAYYNRGIGGQIVDMTESFSVELGYNAICSDTPIVNHRMHDLVTKRGYFTVGHLPNCINIAGHGIVDLVCTFKPLKGVKPLVSFDMVADSYPSKL